MGWEQAEVLGQTENVLVHILVQHARVAFLEIGATTATD